MGLLRQGGAALVAAGAIPVAAGALALRPGWRLGFRERLGLSGEHDAGAVWLHAASVGESMLLARVAPSLRKQGHRVQATLTTTSGCATLRRVLPDLPVRLAPLDHPWSVSAALSAALPPALVLFETELWPSLIAGTKARGIPVALISGRLSDRAYRRYRRVQSLVAATLRRVDRIGARSDSDAQRFIALGADPSRVRVTGDLKLQPATVAPAADLMRLLDGPLILVAGSTHAGEERAALLALSACREAGLSVALVVAPRHLERLPEVERELCASGRSWLRRSEAGHRTLEPGDVLLLDGYGELASVYQAASLAFVGGTLVPVGGHNLLEPVHAGCPVLFGPHLSQVREVASQLVQAGVGRRVDDAAALARACVDGLSASTAGRKIRFEPDQVSRGGPLERSLDLLREVLSEPSP